MNRPRSQGIFDAGFSPRDQVLPACDQFAAWGSRHLGAHGEEAIRGESPRLVRKRESGLPPRVADLALRARAPNLCPSPIRLACPRSQPSSHAPLCASASRLGHRQQGAARRHPIRSATRTWCAGPATSPACPSMRRSAVCPEPLNRLDFDAYRDIRFRPDEAFSARRRPVPAAALPPRLPLHAPGDRERHPRRRADARALSAELFDYGRTKIDGPCR